jgi:hypothetical protein
MRAKAWEVTATDYHFDQEVYSWRHQQPGGKSPTLRIARQVQEPGWWSPNRTQTSLSRKSRLDVFSEPCRILCDCGPGD